MFVVCCVRVSVCFVCLKVFVVFVLCCVLFVDLCVFVVVCCCLLRQTCVVVCCFSTLFDDWCVFCFSVFVLCVFVGDSVVCELCLLLWVVCCV